MKRLRLLLLVINRSGAGTALSIFLAVYLICGLVVLVAEPSITRYTDALWFLWAVSMTVGLGDYTAVTLMGRLAAVVCSLFAIVTTAIITAVVVDFFNERRQMQFGNSLVEFLDKLERLPELNKKELKELAQKVKAYRH